MCDASSEDEVNRQEPWASPRQEPVNGIVQPRVIAPFGKPVRHTKILDYILNDTLEKACQHKNVWPFLNPFDSLALGIPDYHKKITRPMDLTTIKSRIENIYYTSYFECIKDIETVFQNCYDHNDPDDDIVIMARNVHEVIKKSLEKAPGDEIDHEIPMRKRRKSTRNKSRLADRGLKIEKPDRKNQFSTRKICENIGEEMPDSQFEPPGKRLKKMNEKKARPKTTGWSDLPNELKLMVISYMDFRTPFDFAQCSKQCHSLVAASGRLCNRIYLQQSRDILPTFELQFRVLPYQKLWHIEFVSLNWYNKISTSVRYIKLTKFIFDLPSFVHPIRDGEVFHSYSLKEDVFDVISRYANKYLQLYKDCLEEFHMGVKCKARSNLIRGFKLPYLPKLKILHIHQTPRQVCLLKWNFVNFKTVCRVRKSLRLPATTLTFEQLIQLQAEDIFIYLNELSADDLNEYVKYWRDGKLNRNVKDICISGGFSEKNRKTKKISMNWDGLESDVELSQKNQNSYRKNYVFIRSNFDPTKHVCVSVSESYFTMEVDNN